MEDDELTRLAVKLLEKEAQKFIRQRSLTKPGPLKANKDFLRATLKHNEITNRRISGKPESSSADKDKSVSSNQASPEASIIDLDSPSPSTQNMSPEQKPEVCFKMNPVKHHKFSTTISRNNKGLTRVNKLTKDMKVSFKIYKDKTSGNVDVSK